MANNIIGTVGVGAQTTRPDWNQNDPNAKDYIKNRPGGYIIPPSVEITWDGDTTGKETVDVGNGLTLVKIADEAPQIEKFAVESHGSPKALISLELTYDSGKSETKQAEIELVANDDFWIGENESPNCTVLGVMADSANIRGITFAKGLWFSRIEVSRPSSSAKAVVVRGISTTDGGVKKFSTDVIPDELLEGINTAQSTAEAAQSTANTAKSTAEAAQSAAESAQSTANGAIANSITKTDGGISSGIIGGVAIQVKHGEHIDAVLGSDGIRFYQMPSTLYTRIDSTGYACFGHDNFKYVKITPQVGSSSSASVEVCNSSTENVSIDANGDIFVINPKNTLTLLGATGIVIQSSTPNSIKKFKITVDDAGTISATEVTT